MENKEVKIAIDGMGCKSCVAKIEKAVASVQGAEGTVDFGEKTALITAQDNSSSDEALDAIRKLGYGVSVLA
ncbi:heavy-metal-associated domain-containing protein [Paenibacillus caseinilyticus]|uniref:ATPase P n=1 Tax=Paenibacillus mucilaginosus K02 TaxID=997761 RepID=I0BGM9_9BACL|nr:heavy metal-associated domain-containing protein [Paenibacillus mucilaginosus]AFH61526.1 ATPase P [Paenibacillus mucilaginosus K02]